MNDRTFYRIAGFSVLATMAVFFFEFPFYLVRGAFPPVTDAAAQAAFAARNGASIMGCVFLDLIILTLLMVFAAGFRHLILRTSSQQEWLGTLFFWRGAGVCRYHPCC